MTIYFPLRVAPWAISPWWSARRLGEWVGSLPALEEDLGLANMALDLIGQARLLLGLRRRDSKVGGRDEDQLAFLA